MKLLSKKQIKDHKAIDQAKMYARGIKLAKMVDELTERYNSLEEACGQREKAIITKLNAEILELQDKKTKLKK